MLHSKMQEDMIFSGILPFYHSKLFRDIPKVEVKSPSNRGQFWVNFMPFFGFFTTYKSDLLLPYFILFFYFPV